MSKTLFEIMLYCVTKQKYMNGFEIRVRKLYRKFEREPAPDRYSALAAATTSVMFNFTLPRRKIIIYAKPSSKKLRIISLNEHAVPVQCPKTSGLIPSRTTASKHSTDQHQSLEHLFSILLQTEP